MAMTMTARSQTSVTVDMTKVTGNIPSLIYGAGAEDVNHEIYGGLYDQRLFGESFEEPARMGVENFTSYDSPWAIDGDALVLSTTSHGKIVYQGAQVQKGTVSVDMRIDSPNAISGFIIHVTGAATGADSFSGYEIGINAATSRLVVGKHQNNWQPITEVPVDYKAGDWNNIALHIDGATVEIALNGTTVYTLRDTSNPLVSGLVGLRSYGGSARFSHLSIDGTEVALAASPSGVDGFLGYDDTWRVDGGVLSTATTGFAKLVRMGSNMGRGSAEVELRADAPRAISGLLIDVTEAGADNFRGYELSVNAAERTLVVGKHDHDW